MRTTRKQLEALLGTVCNYLGLPKDEHLKLTYSSAYQGYKLELYGYVPKESKTRLAFEYFSRDGYLSAYEMYLYLLGLLRALQYKNHNLI